MDEPAFPPPVPTQVSSPAPTADAGSTLLDPTTWVDVAPVASRRRTRRRGAWAAVGLVAAATVATSAIVLTHGAPAEAYSLAQATTDAQAARTLRFKMAITTDNLGEIEADASFDLDRELMAMTLSIDLANEPIEAVFDLSDNTMYMSTDAFGGELGAMGIEAAWVSLDMEDTAGIDFGEMTQMTGNPLDVSAAFDRAESVVDLGFADVEGEQVKHYEVTILRDDVLAATPELEEMFGDLPLDGLPDEFVYDVYVTETNELRRLGYEIELMGEVMRYDIVVDAVNEPLDIAVPDPSDVIDMSELTNGDW